MKVKIKKWINRYLLAETSAVIGTLLGGILTNMIFHNRVFTALGGTWGENIGYYSIIVLKDIRRSREIHNKITFIILIKTIRNLFVEFGPAEFLDSFFVRPFFMYVFPKILNSLSLGLIAGKFSADLVFYIPTIILYELRNKLLKE